jgi:hypothetical protein
VFGRCVCCRRSPGAVYPPRQMGCCEVPIDVLVPVPYSQRRCMLNLHRTPPAYMNDRNLSNSTYLPSKLHPVSEHLKIHTTHCHGQPANRYICCCCDCYPLHSTPPPPSTPPLNVPSQHRTPLRQILPFVHLFPPGTTVPMFHLAP